MMKSLFLSFLLWQGIVHAKIYDCFTFFNELDLLQIRFAELYDSVDHFVIVESPTTFTGKNKPLYFAENSQRFAEYKDKIIHIVIDDFPALCGERLKDHWMREEFSRNAILQGLHDCQDNDIIIISDLDEIPSAKAVAQIAQYQAKLVSLPLWHKSKLKDEKYVCDLYMRLLMYQMNRENFLGWWGGSKAAPYWVVKKHTPWGMKMFHHYYHPHKIFDAGWHFNTMGGKEKALYKWLNTGPLYDDNEKELNRIGSESSLLEQSFQQQISDNTKLVPIDDGYPQYFLDHLDYFLSIGWIADLNE